MVHRWSKLKRALQLIIDPTTEFQIRCNAYNIGESIPIPRYWITIGKTIVWDFPKNFMDDTSGWYFFDEVQKLSCLIREYVDCPKDELMMHHFDDRWRIIPYIMACDRRIGKRRLRTMLDNTKNQDIREIIQKRLISKE